MVKTFFFLLLPTAALAQEVITSHAPQAISVTIYNKGQPSLIKDRRTITLAAGLNEIIFTNVAREIIPNSLLFSNIQTQYPLTLLEQKFKSTPLTGHNVLEKSIGSPVIAIYDGPNAPMERGILIGADDKGIIIQLPNRIETKFPGRIAFEKLPAAITQKAVLELKVDSPQAFKETVDINYMTKGLSWQADYVLEVDPTGQRTDLNSWISIDNQTGATLEKASVVVAEGDANQGAGGQKLYKINRHITLHDKARKDVSWVNVNGLTLSPSYRITMDAAMTLDQNGVPLHVPVTVWQYFENKKSQGLGIALPAGKMHIYQRGAQDNLLAAGELDMDSVPIDGTVAFPLGEAKTLNATMRQTDYRKLGDKVTEIGYLVQVTNNSAAPANVMVAQRIETATWDIVREDAPHAEGKAFPTWVLLVPSNKKAELRYRLRLVNKT